MANTKKWLVREVGEWGWPREAMYYGVYVGRRPYLSTGNNWVGKREHRVGPRAVEALLPKRYHLEPGGGPVELET
jgi:hypothetical protein